MEVWAGMGAATTGPQQRSLLRSELARDVLLGLLSGLTVAVVITVITEIREDRRVEADLSETDATCIVFDDETGPECTDLSEAILTGADLTDADLSGADMRGTDLTDAVLDGVRYDCDDATTTWPETFDPPPSAAC